MKNDGIAEITMCLNCEKPSCNNCLHDNIKPEKKMGRPAFVVIRSKGSNETRYESVAAAAKAMGCSAYHIRTAIKAQKTFYGYWWNYEGGANGKKQ